MLKSEDLPKKTLKYIMQKKKMFRRKNDSKIGTQYLFWNKLEIEKDNVLKRVFLTK